MTIQASSNSRTSQKARNAIAKVSTGLHIDGEWTAAASVAQFDVINPATQEAIATVADGGPKDALQAIATAGRVPKQ